MSDKKMATYTVTLREIHAVTITVEAPEGTSDAELMNMAADMQSDVCWPSEYEERADWDTWDVWQEGADEEEETVTCKFCRRGVPAATAHLHQDDWVGDECCWDERLRSTE